MYSAPGKLLLFGEHAAVFGFPAIGLSIPRKLHLTVTPAPGLTISFPDLDIPEEQARAFLDHIEQTAAAMHCPPLGGVHLTVRSELPVSSGFGSSAALSTVLARWMLHSGDIVPPAATEAEATRIWSVAHRLEHFFHGTPSGIDTGLTTLEGARSFEFPEPDTDNGGSSADAPRRRSILPRTAPVRLPDATLLAGSVPREKTTRELVASVRARRDASPRRVDDILTRLGAFSVETINHPDTTVEEFGGRALAAHELLRELGVSTPLLDEILQTALAAGAAGGKLSGAGGGGAFYLVCSDDDTATAVADAIRSSVAELQALIRVPLGGV